jgi:hypothetical protein
MPIAACARCDPVLRSIQRINCILSCFNVNTAKLSNLVGCNGDCNAIGRERLCRLAGATRRPSLSSESALRRSVPQGEHGCVLYLRDRETFKSRLRIGVNWTDGGNALQTKFGRSNSSQHNCSTRALQCHLRTRNVFVPCEGLLGDWI